MMNTTRYFTKLLLVWLFIGIILSISKVYANNCVNCHKDPIFRTHNHKLYTYYQDWLTSPHQTAGLTCDQCHSGDPAAETVDAAHKGVHSTSDPRSTIFFKNLAETCGKCHEQVSGQFTKSKHYKSLIVYYNAPYCSTCHRAMNRKPYYHDIVDTTCRSCHNQQMLQSHAELAEEILRRLNITKGYLGWASLYYSSKDWPGTSKQEIQQINTEYHEILAKGHAFDLIDSDRTSAELLSKLRLIFEDAWKTCHTNKECEGIFK